MAQPLLFSRVQQSQPNAHFKINVGFQKIRLVPLYFTVHKIGWDIYWPNISQCCWKMQVPREALYGQLLLWVGDMEKWVVEFLNRGYIMKRFLPKNQHIQQGEHYLGNFGLSKSCSNDLKIYYIHGSQNWFQNDSRSK